MKIEKLTENKIRIIVKSSDLKIDTLDFHFIMNIALKDKKFFLNILKKAKTELGFDTDGCNLLIEVTYSYDDIFIFIITKYSINNSLKNNYQKKLYVKRKSINKKNKNIIYKFSSFDEFCEFCIYINNIFNNSLNAKKIFTNSSLYLYNNTYYLVLKNFTNSC